METGESILALDIGGTKMLAALVDGRDVRATQVLATPQTGDPAGWLAALFAAIGEWRGRYTAVGVAVTGIVDDGCWSALNRRTLDIPDRFPLVETVAALAGTDRVSAANDAQAAAWGESRFGAGQGGDLVFLTISTGIGGGIVLNGRLLGGLAGHFGQFRTAGADGTLEDGVSGRFIADAAQTHLPGASARDVFSAANEGADWAERIVETSARRAATLLRNIHLAIDPPCIVIGGGIGLAPGYLDRLRALLSPLPPRLTPRLLPAALADKAGVIGIAALARNESFTTITKRENDHDHSTL